MRCSKLHFSDAKVDNILLCARLALARHAIFPFQCSWDRKRLRDVCAVRDHPTGNRLGHLSIRPFLNILNPCRLRYRLRVVPLSLSPSFVKRKKTARKKWPLEVVLVARRVAPKSSRPFLFSRLLRVTHDGLSERGTTRSLLLSQS